MTTPSLLDFSSYLQVKTNSVLCYENLFCEVINVVRVLLCELSLNLNLSLMLFVGTC